MFLTNNSTDLNALTAVHLQNVNAMFHKVV